MATSIEQDHRSCWSETFWIDHCEGFQVEAPEGHLGVVEGIRRGSNGEIPTLLVREGATERRLVPASLVKSVDGWRELVTLGEAGSDSSALKSR